MYQKGQTVSLSDDAAPPPYGGRSAVVESHNYGASKMAVRIQGIDGVHMVPVSWVYIPGVG